MKTSSMFKSLCLPSKVYLVLGLVAVLMSIISPAVFGGASLLMHLVHLVYIVFWTWILNLICGAGYKWISWVLVLAPFVVFFILLAVTSRPSVAAVDDKRMESPVIVLSQ